MKPIHRNSFGIAMFFNYLKFLLIALLVTESQEAAFAQPYPTNGLVAFYPLNGNANDASGNGYNGVVHSTLTFITNQIGVTNAATRFSNGYITVTPTPFNVNSNWTISTWCIMDSGTSGPYDMAYTAADNSGGLIMRWVGASSPQGSWYIFGGHQSGVDSGAYRGYLVSTATNNSYKWNMFTCTKSGTNYQIFLNGTILTSNTCLASVTDQGTFYIGSGQFSLSGSLSDMLIYSRALTANEIAQLYIGESTSPAVTITSDITNTSALFGSNATFQVTAFGPNPITYQWYLTNNNPAQIAQAYAQTFSNFVYNAVVTNGGFGYGKTPHVTFVGGNGSGASGYGVISNGMVTSIVVTNAGAGYTGIPTVVIDSPNGILIGVTNSSLTISNLNPSNSGGYFVVVSNLYNSVTSSIGYVTLLYPSTIVSNPVSVNLSLHGSNTLKVSATGTSPLSYQWTFNTTNISGANGTSYSITNFAVTNIGNYAVIVSNPYGTVTSTIASVQMIPSLTVPFTGSLVLWGQPDTLTVGAVGSGTVTYQWYFNGVAIAGANNNTYSFTGVQFTDAGLYSVVASNAYGSVSNNAYQLVVNPANISLGLFAGVIIQGTVGYSYNIQSTTDLSNTNAWVTQTNITLTTPIQIWDDNSTDVHAPGNVKKFYRVLAGQ